MIFLKFFSVLMLLEHSV